MMGHHHYKQGLHSTASKNARKRLTQRTALEQQPVSRTAVSAVWQLQHVDVRAHHVPQMSELTHTTTTSATHMSISLQIREELAGHDQLSDVGRRSAVDE